jgi:hypothetical protein
VIFLSTKPIAQKLFIKEKNKIYFVNAPENYLEKIGDLPNNVIIVKKLEKDLDVIQIFVKNKAELEDYLPKVKDFLKEKGKLWITYYKGTSKIKTDINRDSINEYALSLNLKGIFMISIDEDWSALRVKKID